MPLKYDLESKGLITKSVAYIDDCESKILIHSSVFTPIISLVAVMCTSVYPSRIKGVTLQKKSVVQKDYKSYGNGRHSKISIHNIVISIR